MPQRFVVYVAQEPAPANPFEVALRYRHKGLLSAAVAAGWDSATALSSSATGGSVWHQVASIPVADDCKRWAACLVNALACIKPRDSTPWFYGRDDMETQSFCDSRSSSGPQASIAEHARCLAARDSAGRTPVHILASVDSDADRDRIIEDWMPYVSEYHGLR